MAKESRKCDSLRVAYGLQFNTLQAYAADNLEYLSKVTESNLQRELLQSKLDESVKALRKKKSNWILPTMIGVVGGLVIGGLVSN
ncbi:hypothetical protein [Winogradskyella forsetii]|uniref:hypothetical protein n=1 Tax=Winogradskyella forsetii TaxID=2686077 RepID=UPI0015C0E785|nr:hypothetical protein [Winogradskyella forsetii]